jgi:hypothetical protein
MTAATARGYPYVLPADTVNSYPSTSQALANAIDSKLGGPVATGQYTIPAVATGATTSVVITLPVGRFSATPQVLLVSENSRLILSVNSSTAASFTMMAGNWSGATSPAGVTGYWMTYAKVP